ncbi:gtpase-activating protein gyp10 [Ophiostoma piceae UAMH 11346]|uniref:Gtpase-activating protein gyp10 n=1 Tax=Ophiostoma piceae (strain UAMH 11346) TaxID=1262450 RepID=S3BQ15_OPHP1|nr:gtpase-activating protein gyp10 [Ophiostoma piceae UAMH 11346]
MADKEPVSVPVPVSVLALKTDSVHTHDTPSAIEQTMDDKTDVKAEVEETPPIQAAVLDEADGVCEKAGDTAERVREDPAVEEKKQQIRDACRAADFGRLQKLAVLPGGFISNELRQIAWPLLLGIPVDGDHVDPAVAAASAGVTSTSRDWTQLPAHHDEEQVQLDVNRAFVYYPRGLSAADEASQKEQLSDLIVEVLRRHPFLCYFQGFHDICQVFLLVLAATPAIRTPAVTRLALLRIRDFMLPTIDAAVQQLLLLPDILHAADPALWSHLRLAQHPRPFFALSGTLTMYAHDVQTLGAIARVFDVLLARPPAFSLYFFAAIACAHREALFATPADEPEMLHHILSKLPARAGGDDSDDSDDLFGVKGAASSLDSLVAEADRLLEEYPPHSLSSWRSVPTSSVLKTVEIAADAQTVDDGEELFHEHVLEIARAEKRRQQIARVRKVLRQYRGPIRAVGVAVLVGVIAVALQRTAGGRGGTSHALMSGPMAKISTILSRLGIYLG